MGRIGSALQALYDKNDARNRVEPAVRVIRSTAPNAVEEPVSELDSAPDMPTLSESEGVAIDDVSVIKVVSELPEATLDDVDELSPLPVEDASHISSEKAWPEESLPEDNREADSELEELPQSHEVEEVAESLIEPTDEVLTEGVLTDEVLTDEVLTDEVLTDEVLTDEVLTDEVLTDEVLTDEVLTDEVLTDEVSTDEVSTDEVLTDEVLTDEVLTEGIEQFDDATDDGQNGVSVEFELNDHPEPEDSIAPSEERPSFGEADLATQEIDSESEQQSTVHTDGRGTEFSSLVQQAEPSTEDLAVRGHSDGQTTTSELQENVDEGIENVRNLVEQVLGVPASDIANVNANAPTEEERSEASEQASESQEESRNDSLGTLEELEEASTDDEISAIESFEATSDQDATESGQVDARGVDGQVTLRSTADSESVNQEMESDAAPLLGDTASAASSCEFPDNDTLAAEPAVVETESAREAEFGDVNEPVDLPPAVAESALLENEGIGPEPVSELLEQVLGISPSSDISEVEIGERYEEEPWAENQESDESDSELEERLHDDVAELIDNSEDVITEKLQTTDAFQPAMQTWADLPATDIDPLPNPIRADAKPPFANTPSLDQDEGRHAPTAKLQPPLPETGSLAIANSSTSEIGSPGTMTDNASNDSPPAESHDEAAFDETDSPVLPDTNPPATEAVPPALQPGESDPDEQSDYVLAPLESPDVAFDTTQAWSPAMGALGRLEAKATPLAFERAMAERVLDSDFGSHIQELSQQITKELPANPASLLFVSMEDDDQRADIVTGLAMHICGCLDAVTLLVDADVNSKQISRNFEQNGPGLAENMDLDSAWYDAVVATSCEGLRLCPSGADNREREADQLQDAARYLFDEWRSSFGLAIIDGGTFANPLLPHLAGLADAVYLCVRLGADERNELAIATERLAAWNAQLKGCITTGPASN